MKDGRVKIAHVHMSNQILRPEPVKSKSGGEGAPANERQLPRLRDVHGGGNRMRLCRLLPRLLLQWLDFQ